MVADKTGQPVKCPIKKCGSINVLIDLQTVVWDANSEESKSNCVCNDCGHEFKIDDEPNSVISNFGLGG